MKRQECVNWAKHMISYLIEQHGDIILVPREDAQLAALEKDEAAAQSAEADIEAGGETIEAVSEAGLRLLGRRLLSCAVGFVHSIDT